MSDMELPQMMQLIHMCMATPDSDTLLSKKMVGFSIN
jgi:hypothetical protein